MSVAVRADVDQPTKFLNRDGVANTRHNMSQRTIGGSSVIMNPYRNDYGEVCVYCHTPHGSSSTVTAPLWNRTASSASYQLYSGAISQQVSSPGPNSLTCLSCHDGTLGIDSVINMPGSGNYSSAQQTSQDDTFLNTWTNEYGPDAGTHLALNAAQPNTGCLACHSADAGFVGAGATDFRAFALGTDLTNDHPVGITYPTGVPGLAFNPPTPSGGFLSFFDRNGNARADSDEVRLYDSGDGFEVECASCHDPHGVPVAGAGSNHTPSFLRVDNTSSSLCLTCHAL